MHSRILEESLIESFRIFYERMLDKTIHSFEDGNYEKALKLASATAYFAWNYHSGVFSEAKLDEIILKIGEKLDSLVEDSHQPLFRLSDNQAKGKRILHIATELHDIGGHSRLITNWIKNDLTNNHSLIVTNQPVKKIPASVSKIIHNNNGEIALLSNEESILKRAAILRLTAQQFDFIILHQHPDDLIPLVAFATKQSPPVAIMNHADHVFWLGASIADLVIELREFGISLTKNRRKGKHSLILPIPLTVNEPQVSRAEARRKLGLKDDQVVLISIGSEYKYLRSRIHDFSATAKRILERNPQAVLFIIGAKANSERFNNHERMHFLGIISDPTLYQQAADIYLEGFPCSSFTGLLETALLGVCPVLMYSPQDLIAFRQEMSLQNSGKRAVSEEDYIVKVSDMIRQPEQRAKITNVVKGDIISYHYDLKWHQYLNDIYNFLMNCTHHPSLITETQFTIQTEDLVLVELKNNYLQFLKYPIWLEICSQPKLLNSLTLKEIASIFFKSVRTGDTRTPRDVIRWTHAFKPFKLNK